MAADLAGVRNSGGEGGGEKRGSGSRGPDYKGEGRRGLREGQGEAAEESAAATAASGDVRESNSGSGRETKAVAHWA